MVFCYSFFLDIYDLCLFLKKKTLMCNSSLKMLIFRVQLLKNCFFNYKCQTNWRYKLYDAYLHRPFMLFSVFNPVTGRSLSPAIYQCSIRSRPVSSSPYPGQKVIFLWKIQMYKRWLKPQPKYCEGSLLKFKR